MDFYGYYRRKLENFPSEETVKDLTAQAVRILDEGPLLAGLEAGVSLLEALRNWQNSPEGVALLPYYTKIKEAVSLAMDGAEADVELGDSLTAGGENDQTAETPQAAPPERGPVFPDFDRWEEWSPSEWENWQRYQDKVLAAAKCGLVGLSLPIVTLEQIRDNTERLPMGKRVRIAIWTAGLVDEIHSKTEAAVYEISRCSLYTAAGQQWQKRILRDGQNNGEQAGGNES